MKIKLNTSIKNEVDEVIATYGAQSLEHISLLKHEYIAFIEEAKDTGMLLPGLYNSFYNGVKIILEQ